MGMALEEAIVSKGVKWSYYASHDCARQLVPKRDLVAVPCAGSEGWTQLAGSGLTHAVFVIIAHQSSRLGLE